MFSKLRNQLRGVTLNNKVKLKLGLIGSRTQLKMCAMASEDDGYVLDADGNRILVGLTLDETREFERLDQLILSLSPVSAEARSLNELRWLILYDRHEAALRSYLTTENAEALKGLRTESDF